MTSEITNDALHSADHGEWNLNCMGATMTFVEFLCLAYSRKHQGKCIAGLRTDGNGWIRPVSKQPDGTLTTARCQLNDGSPPQPLDVLRAGLMGPRPLPHQPENWVLGSTPMELVQRPAESKALSLLADRLETGPAIFGTTSPWIAFDSLANRAVSQSLTLVCPGGLQFYSKENYLGFRQLRATFELQSAGYDLPVTDPHWENCQELVRSPFFKRHAWSSIAGADAVPIITVSLSEPYAENGRCYKLAACIFVAPPTALCKSSREI